MADTVRAIEDSCRILSFLENVDDSHPSIPRDEWHETARIALENGSPGPVRPPAKRIGRMSETLWDLHHFYQFDWREFEHLVSSVYDEKGFTTDVTPSSNDQGVDIWADKGGERTAIQVKKFAKGNPVGRPAVQKIVSTLARGDTDRAIVVTSNSFSGPAEEYAAGFGPKLELVDGEELVRLLTESGTPPPV